MAASPSKSNPRSPSAATGDGGAVRAKALGDLPTNANSQSDEPSCAKNVPPKASKLSSRNNRRKRRDRDNNGPTASKRARGGSRRRDRAPIPSFTPLTDVYQDERGAERDENMGASAAATEAASLVCIAGTKSSGDSNGIEAGQPSNDVTAKTNDNQLSGNGHNDGETGSFASKPEYAATDDPNVTSKNATVATTSATANATQQKVIKETISSGKVGNITRAPPDDGALVNAKDGTAEDGTIAKKGKTDYLGKPNEGPEPSSLRDSYEPASGSSANRNDLALKQLLTSSLDDEVKNCTEEERNTTAGCAESSLLNGGAPAIEKLDRGGPTDRNASRQKPPNSPAKKANDVLPQHSDEKGTPSGIITVGKKVAKDIEVIEIDIKDDDDDANIVSIKAHGKKGCVQGKKKAPLPNQTKKKRKAPPAKKSSLDDGTKKAKRVKEPRKQPSTKTGEGISFTKSNKLCFACSTCKCETRTSTERTPRKFAELTGSDARQEQSMLQRIQKLDRDIAWKQGQKSRCHRELGKIQRRIRTTWESVSSTGQDQRPRFLADADVSDDFAGKDANILCIGEVNRAQSRIFGKQKSKPSHQPTLTQIIGGSNEADDDGDEKRNSQAECNNSVKIENERGKETKAPIEKGSSLEGDFLAFWSEPPAGTTECTGSMSDFNRAMIKFKEIKRTGKWAKATASMLEIEAEEAEEGFDALVDLFDTSMEKSTSSDTGMDFSQNSVDEDSVDMDRIFNTSASPTKCEQVAREIQASVEDDATRKASIERMCPKWKENIRYAQAQPDPADLKHALDKVMQAKANLDQMKDRVLQAFVDRHQTLTLFEQSLKGFFEITASKTS